jgi:DNA-binding response OmpR family regulator
MPTALNSYERFISMCSKENKCKALWVEDEELMASAIAAHAVEDMESIVVPDLVEAGRYLSTKEADVIILDLNLHSPHGSSTGIATLDGLRGMVSNAVPIIVFTGGYDSNLYQVSLSHGASAYILKGEMSIRNVLLIAHAFAGQYRDRERLRRERDEKEKARLKLEQEIAGLRQAAGLKGDAIDAAVAKESESERLERMRRIGEYIHTINEIIH